MVKKRKGKKIKRGKKSGASNVLKNKNSNVVKINLGGGATRRRAPGQIRQHSGASVTSVVVAAAPPTNAGVGTKTTFPAPQSNATSKPVPGNDKKQPTTGLRPDPSAQPRAPPSAPPSKPPKPDKPDTIMKDARKRKATIAEIPKPDAIMSEAPSVEPKDDLKKIKFEQPQTSALVVSNPPTTTGLKRENNRHESSLLASLESDMRHAPKSVQNRARQDPNNPSKQQRTADTLEL